MKKLKSERGATLLLVMGLILILVLLMTPLLMNLNVGLLQTATDGHTEKAFDEAESAAAVYKRLFNEAVKVEEAKKSYLEESDAVALATNLNAARLFPNLQVTPLITTSKKAVEFASYSGAGQQKRGRAVQLGFEQIKTTTTENSNSTSEDVFYWKHGVVMNRPNYNYIYTNVGTSPNNKNYEFISNSYPSAKYTTEFNDYMKKYTGDSFNTRLAHWPVVTLDQPLPSLPIPAEVMAINNVSTQKSKNFSSGDGINWAGDVNLTTSSSEVTINKLSNGNAIETTGSVTLPAWSKSTFNGNVKVGQNFTARGNGGDRTLTINGNLMVRGNANFSDNYNAIYVKGNLLVNEDLTIGDVYTEMVVEGDLIVGKKINFSGKLVKLTVKGSISSGTSISFNNGGAIIVNGDLISGTNFYITSAFDYLQVKGAISARENITFTNSIGIISAGNWSNEWSSQSNDGQAAYLAGTAVGNDRKSIIAGNTLDFNNTITTLRVTGNISSKILFIRNTMRNVRVNGSIITNGDLSIAESVTDWMINEHFYSNGTTTLPTTQKLHIKGTFYSKTKIRGSSTLDNVIVQGSLLSQGPIVFDNTINNVNIGGDLVSNSEITLKSVTNSTVNGYMLANGEINFSNDIDNFTLNNDMIAQGDISFMHLASIKVNGAIAAKGNLAFKNTLGACTVTKDLIAAGSISIQGGINSGFKVNGMLAALKDISFKNNIGDGVTFGGFYSGGSTSFAGWYGDGYSAKGNIKIKHNPPSTTITKEITIIKTKISNNWNSRATYGQP